MGMRQEGKKQRSWNRFAHEVVHRLRQFRGCPDLEELACVVEDSPLRNSRRSVVRKHLRTCALCREDLLSLENLSIALKPLGLRKPKGRTSKVRTSPSPHA